VVSHTVELSLQVELPFDAEGHFQWLSARAVPAMETVTNTSYARTLRLPSGPARVSARFDPEMHLSPQPHIEVTAELADRADEAELRRRLRRLFGIDVGQLRADEALAKHAELAPLIEMRPGVRLVGAVDPHEMLIRTMIGQQVTVAAARTNVTRLVEALGEELPVVRQQRDGLEAHLTKLFPTMSQIAQHAQQVLRGPGARLAAIAETAAALADGSLTISVEDDTHEQRAALLKRKGIGPWTADYVRMRVLGDPDILLSGDIAVRNGADRIGLPYAARDLEQWAQRCAPYRSYLTTHLWGA
jgi:AraC family transcriptional regulator of adaptative response / DNA-3-methyladenine glycosylase II